MASPRRRLVRAVHCQGLFLLYWKSNIWAMLSARVQGEIFESVANQHTAWWSRTPQTWVILTLGL